MNDKWLANSHFHGLGESGDSDGWYELTNGDISIGSKDEAFEFFEKAARILNNAGIKLFESNVDGLQLENHLVHNEYNAMAKEHVALHKRSQALLEALESIANAPVPANEREYISWFVTAKNLAGGAVSGYHASVEYPPTPSVDQKGGDNEG